MRSKSFTFSVTRARRSRVAARRSSSSGGERGPERPLPQSRRGRHRGGARPPGASGGCPTAVSTGQKLQATLPEPFGLTGRRLVRPDLLVDLFCELGVVPERGFELLGTQPETARSPVQSGRWGGRRRRRSRTRPPRRPGRRPARPAAQSGRPQCDEWMPANAQTLVDQLFGERGRRGLARRLFEAAQDERWNASSPGIPTAQITPMNRDATAPVSHR